MRVFTRADVGVATLTFETVIPEHGDHGELVAVVRVQTSLDHLKRINDVLTRTLDRHTSLEEGRS
jgi:hypothetical protein